MKYLQRAGLQLTGRTTVTRCALLNMTNQADIGPLDWFSLIYMC